MKRISLIYLLLCIAGGIYALESAFIGISGEANGNSKEGIAAGGALTVALDINRYFSAGLKTGYFSNLDNLYVIENAVLFRFYPITKIPLFLQADIGVSFLQEDDMFVPVFLGGLNAGWRFNINNFYIEPVVRGGYPFIWGAGLNIGMSFNNEKKKE
jgi:hypothetical protein